MKYNNLMVVLIQHIVKIEQPEYLLLNKSMFNSKNTQCTEIVLPYIYIYKSTKGRVCANGTTDDGTNFCLAGYN